MKKSPTDSPFFFDNSRKTTAQMPSIRAMARINRVHPGAAKNAPNLLSPDIVDSNYYANFLYK